MIAYCATDGTYGYRGDGAGGSGQTLRDVCARLNDAREWPGGKTAVLTGIKALFDTEGGYVTRAGGISI
jgi:hypothetical protein